MSKFKQVKTNSHVPIEKTGDLAVIQEHYQDYPYPDRDPKDETKRLLVISGEFLGELNIIYIKVKRILIQVFEC